MLRGDSGPHRRDSAWCGLFVFVSRRVWSGVARNGLGGEWFAGGASLVAKGSRVVWTPPKRGGDKSALKGIGGGLLFGVFSLWWRCFTGRQDVLARWP